ncbi:complement C1q protein [Bacillus cereus]|nr:complement C1q protein [Bacillus cereus]
MKSLLLSLILSLGLGTGAASAQEDAQASVDQPAVQYMMVDPGGH